MEQVVESQSLPGILPGVLAVRYAALLQRIMQRARQEQREEERELEEGERREHQERKDRILDRLWSVTQRGSLVRALGGGKQG
jgi:hypothetical protein